jgi:hypothetical protein
MAHNDNQYDLPSNCICTRDVLGIHTVSISSGWGDLKEEWKVWDIKFFNSRLIYLTAIIIIASSIGACAAPRILGAIDGLHNDGLDVIAWSNVPIDTTCLLLSLKGEFGPRYTAYGRMNQNGAFITGPDSISQNLFLRQEMVLFGGDGEMYAYTNPEYRRDLFEYFEYDPYHGKFSANEFTDPPLGYIMAANNIRPLGNILYGKSWSHDHPYMIVIHDVNANTFSATHIDIGRFASNADGIQINGLPGNKLLIVGTAASDSGQYDLCNMIYDLSSRTIISSEEIPLDSLSDNGFLRFSSPGPSQIFRHDDFLYYLAIGRKTWDSLDSIRYDTYLIQYDKNGQVVETKDVAPLQIKESKLTTTPSQIVLLKDHAGKFWMISIDDFPVLQLDKNEK